jgi:2-oxoglutarate dehydrogenase complex dehydrogenase (E1) component-like enzyme
MTRDVLELGGSLGFLDEIYERFQAQPSSVDASWHDVLDGQDGLRASGYGLRPDLRKNGGHRQLELLALGAVEIEIDVAREVVVVAQLEAVPAGDHGDAGAHDIHRADEPAVDVDLRVGDVRAHLHDRFVARDAVRRRLGPAGDKDGEREDPA